MRPTHRLPVLASLVPAVLLAVAPGAALGASPATSPIPSPVPSPVPSASAVSERPGDAWHRVSVDPAIVAGARMTDITLGGPGFVAVGVDENGAPVAWTSADGLTWERHEVARSPEFPTVGGSDWPLLDLTGPVVAQGPDGFVMVDRGTTLTDPAIRGFGARRVWVSPDGADWTPVAGTEGGLDPSPAGLRGMTPGPLMDVSGTPAGFVAIGWAEHNGQSVPQAGTSTDGRTWLLTRERTAIVTPAKDPVRLPIVAWMPVALTDTGDGLLAVAQRSTLFDAVLGKAQIDIVLLRSADGTDWTVSAPKGLTGRRFDAPAAVAATAGREVIVGSSQKPRAMPGPGAPAAWYGHGNDWHAARVERPAGAGGATAAMLAVAATTGATAEGDLGFVAVGAQGAGGATQPVAWSTTDGSAWTLAPIDDPSEPADAAMAAVVAASDRLVAVGRAGADAAIWISGAPAGG